MNPPVLPDLLLVEPQFVMRRTMVAVAREMRVAEIHEATSVARALPVVAIAAEWQHDLAGKLDRIPRLRVLPKPFRIRQLLESVSRMGLG